MRFSHALSLCLAVLFGSALSGCVVYDNDNDADDPRPGDISFLWSFDGEQRCSRAGVDYLEVQVVTASGALAFGDVVDCVGGGITIVDFEPGEYELWLDAFSADDQLVYTADVRVLVQGGRTNDLGVIDLEPVVRAGSVALFWGFLYPTDKSLVFDCATAGVEEVYVELAPCGDGEGFAQTFDCEDEGVIVDGLAEGRYQLTLIASGLYQQRLVDLYDAVQVVAVTAGHESDLGDVPLERIESRFGDIEITWALSAGTCEELGVTEVTFSIRRLSKNLVDDSFTVECNRTFALRRTFVPGAYLIEASAAGDGGTYVGSHTFEISPGQVATPHVELVLSE